MAADKGLADEECREAGDLAHDEGHPSEDQRLGCQYPASLRDGDQAGADHPGRVLDPTPGHALETDDAEHLLHPAAGDAVTAGQAQQVVEGPAAAVQRLGVEEGADLAHGRRQVSVTMPGRMQKDRSLTAMAAP